MSKGFMLFRRNAVTDAARDDASRRFTTSEQLLRSSSSSKVPDNRISVGVTPYFTGVLTSRFLWPRLLSVLSPTLVFIRQVINLESCEIGQKACTWLREISSCSCSTVLPRPAWLLLNKIAYLGQKTKSFGASSWILPGVWSLTNTWWDWPLADPDPALALSRTF